MKRLNRKGYMTVEIILAAVITFAIAFFLIDLTMNVTSVTDNTYEDTVLITDKSLIIKNLKENIENDICRNGGIHSVICNNNVCTINTNNSGISRKLIVENNTLNYTDASGTIIYTKKTKESFSNMTLTSSNSVGYYNFKIKGENIFIDKSYNINVIIYNKTSC